MNKNNIKRITTILALIFVVACGNSSVPALKAHIFERKLLRGNKLFLAYTYKKGSRMMSDSCVVDNAVIPQDSIYISVLTKKPVRGGLKLP
jgi:hypothetical protein